MSAMSARSCRLHAEKESHQHHRKMFTWHLSGVHDNDSAAHEPPVTHTAYSAKRQREIEARRKYANQLQMKNSISSNPIHTSPIPASTLERLTLVLLHTLFFFRRVINSNTRRRRSRRCVRMQNARRDERNENKICNKCQQQWCKCVCGGTASLSRPSKALINKNRHRKAHVDDAVVSLAL